MLHEDSPYLQAVAASILVNSSPVIIPSASHFVKTAIAIL